MTGWLEGLRFRLAMFLIRCAELLAPAEPSHEEDEGLH